MTAAVVHHLSVYPLKIALRRTFVHAVSRRDAADAVVVRVELTRGTTGFGETLPRPDVTEETVGSVVTAIPEVFGPSLMAFRAPSFFEALEHIEALPHADATGRRMPAARAAVELALLDASLRMFHRTMDDVVQWMGLPGFGRPGSLPRIRFGGVLAGDSASDTRTLLRKMLWYGLRHFKLSVGVPNDRDRLELALRMLRRLLRRGRATLRVDAEGAWMVDEAEAWLRSVEGLPIDGVEQPLARGKENELPRLKTISRVPLIHDESLTSIDDAQRLIDLDVADVLSIRISQCGGLLPSLRLAALARRSGSAVQLGCMVGETSILGGAGLRFLEVCPGVRWAEGCFGNRLLSEDVVSKSLRSRYGGRPPASGGSGLVSDVDEARVTALCPDAPFEMHF